MTVNFVSAEWYGASPSNSDNVTELQAAFDFCYNNGLGGVRFPVGTFATSAINYKGQSIIGSGLGTTILKGHVLYANGTKKYLATYP